MSLTPKERKAEATSAAMWEGGVNGLMTLVPSAGAVYLAMRNSPRFLARTNMQSRTALAIMPALFVFGWTAVRESSSPRRYQDNRNTDSLELQLLLPTVHRKKS